MSILEFGEAETPLDNPPGGALVCDNCGNSFDHAGRGRKPKKCPECRSTNSGSNSAPKRGRTATADVKAALAVMDSAYSLATTGLMFISPQAASTIASQVDRLQASNEQAFTFDKSLCQTIAKLGEKSGKAIFIGTQLSIVLPVVAILFSEMQERRAQVEEEQLQYPDAQPTPDGAKPTPDGANPLAFFGG